MKKQIIAAKEYQISHNLIDTNALKVIKKLQKSGFEAYIVGGAIRDLLLAIPPKDFDIVTNASPEVVRKVFKNKALIIGRRFKIVHVIFEQTSYRTSDNIEIDIGSVDLESLEPQHLKIIRERQIIEVSTYRSTKVSNNNINQFGKIVVDNNYGTQSEDANRRDFTINALYYDPIKEIIVDYHNGMADLQNRQIRIIGEPISRYTQDPVRILRAIRLAIKLNLEIENKTAKAFEKSKHLLVNEHPGRLYEEMLKILLSGHSLRCIHYLINLGLPKEVFILFDKLFFGKAQDELALKILEKTDKRLQEGNAVSTMFILAGLMWNFVYQNWNRNKIPESNSRDYLLEAIYEVRNYAYTIGVTRSAFNSLSDIWLLQFDFENLSPKRLNNVINHMRFRQAWHLFSLRYEFGQIDIENFKWWDKFINANPHERLLIAEEFTMNFDKPTLKKKRKRKSKKLTQESDLNFDSTIDNNDA